MVYQRAYYNIFDNLCYSLSPEQLFLNWSTEAIVDIQSLETLARVTHIDILDLCIQSAEYHLLNNDLDKALDCLTYSKVCLL